MNGLVVDIPALDKLLSIRAVQFPQPDRYLYHS